MDILEALQRFYYDTTLNELRLMNENTLYPNISYNSLLYLDLISYMENCTVSGLAAALHISKAAVTSKVNELIRMGLVEKAQSTQDRRVYYLSLTPQMQEDYRQYDARLQCAVRALKAQFTPEETACFSKMLTVVREHYVKEDEHHE